MPEQYTLTNLPQPNQSGISLKEIPARPVAVIRFSGLFSEERAQHKHAQLIEWLTTQKVKYKNQVSYARYNPPGTPPFMNRHEVWIELEALTSPNQINSLF
jgi:DNA gyrase inhibitor GyrI